MPNRMDRYDRGEGGTRGRSRSVEPRWKDDRRNGSRERGNKDQERDPSDRHRSHRDGHGRISGSPSRSRSPRRRRSRSKSPRRRDSRSRSSDRHGDRARGKRRRSLSTSRSRSRSASPQSSTSTDHRRQQKRKEKHKQRSSRSRERKERKREKKEKKKKKGGAVTSQWGKYGIISETDLYTKDQEFRTWLMEERVINPETISKEQTKKEFAKFVEDYNTATLPNEKYYNMEAYDRRMAALRAGETLPPADDGYNPTADLLAHASRHKKKEVEHQSYLSKEQLQELRKVQNERIEVGKMKRLGMDVKQTFGVRMEFDA